MEVAKDKSEALVTYVQVRGMTNNKSRKLKLQGLDPKAIYQLEGTEESYSGEILMKGGYLFKDFWEMRSADCTIYEKIISSKRKL